MGYRRDRSERRVVKVLRRGEKGERYAGRVEVKCFSGPMPAR